MSTTANVGTPSKAYAAMAARWKLIDTLLGGTAAMRAAGHEYLPQEERESAKAYSNRLSRSFLYGGLSDTIEKFVSKPFSRKVGIKSDGEMPEKLAEIEWNADLRGSTLTDFAREMFRDGLSHGLSCLFVDYPKTMREDGSTPSAGEEARMGARPYFQHFHSSTVIGARPKIGADGVLVPTVLRVKETRTEEDDNWGEVEKCYVRVYTETYTQEWSKLESESDWKPGPKVAHTLGKIPVIPFYVKRDGFFSALPPFEDLGWMNLWHWQSESDQNHILHWGRFAQLFGSGFSQEEMDKEFELGPNRIIRTTNPNARLGYVEPTGAAIEAGHRHGMSIEARMEVLGLAPAMERIGNQTAMARGIDDSNAKSSIQGWLQSLEDVLDRGYEIAAEMAGQKLPEGFSTDIFKDFTIGHRAQQDIQALIQLASTGKIDDETLLYEIRRRGVLDETTDIQEVMRKAKDQGPPLGFMFGGGDREDPKGEPEDDDDPRAAA